MGLYVFGYGFFRFFIEYFREPDADLGYRIQLGEKISNADLARFHPLLSFSTGQILCAAMIAAAILWWVIAAKLPDNKVVQVFPGTGAAPPPPKTETEKKA